jgi:hypothetical protein
VTTTIFPATFMVSPNAFRVMRFSQGRLHQAIGRRWSLRYDSDFESDGHNK